MLLKSFTWALGGVLLCASLATASQPPAVAPAEVVWHTDYSAALRQAREEHKLLFVYFHGAANDSRSRDFERRSLSRTDVQSSLAANYVCAKLPLNAAITIDGESRELLDHPAYKELRHGQGFAIVDYAHPGEPYYKKVVSIVPLKPGKYYKYQPRHLPIALQLPAGTLTQRSLVLAVRIHPQRPKSTSGTLDRHLLSGAGRHSRYQARLRVQGHHRWDQRFPVLSRLLPRGLRAQEVVAESWPNEGLMDAAVDIVWSWSQSPGHWSAVSSAQPRYAYDMHRSSNGIWYATGLFGNRH